MKFREYLNESEYLNEARKAQKLSKGDYIGGCLESLYAVYRGIIVEDNVYYWYAWTGDEVEQGLQASINAYRQNPKQAKRVEKEWLGPSGKFKIVCGGNDVYKFGSLEKANEWVNKVVERGYI